MEKTLQFALNEALENGRKSAMPEFLEMELREKIAQEIESHCFLFGTPINVLEIVAKEIIDILIRKSRNE
jgi:hypothetical protein